MHTKAPLSFPVMGGEGKSLAQSAPHSSRGVLGWMIFGGGAHLLPNMDTCWAMKYQVFHCFLYAIAVGTCGGVLLPNRIREDSSREVFLPYYSN